MTDKPTIEPVLYDALNSVSDFISQTTGFKPTQAEIADALTRYFVLNEIKGHILMLWENEDGEDVR